MNKLTSFVRKVIYYFTFGAFVLASPAYSFAATLSLTPSTSTMNRGCSFSLNVDLDATGVQTDGTDAILRYDPTRFTATSIASGTIYPDYPGNSIDTQTGKINISGLASPDQAFSSKGTLATVNFIALQGAPTGTTQITFDFDPNDKTKTTDSNIVERGTIADRLDSVTNGTYTVGTGVCSSGTGTGTGGGTTVVKTGTGGSLGGLTPGKGGLESSASGKTLDDYVGEKSGIMGPTFFFSVIGGVLVILGILGLALF